MSKNTINLKRIAVNLRRFLSCSFFTLFEILAVRITLFESLLTTWRKPMLSRELQMLNILPSETVLHLGCGAFPSAALYIAQKKKVRVIGIDNNYIAVRLAQLCIKKKNMENFITIIYADGVNHQVQDFDVVYIAINVWPIDRVLFHLYETMKPTARVLCKGSHQDIPYLLKKKEFQSLFSICSTIEYPKMQSFLLKKKVNI